MAEMKNISSSSRIKYEMTRSRVSFRRDDWGGNQDDDCAPKLIIGQPPL
jgi:hypothetical protein